MPITIAQLAKLEQDPFNKAVYLDIIRNANLLETFPFETVDSLRVMALEVKSMPDVAWRGMNEGYTESSTAELDQVFDSLYGFGGDIQYDKVIEKLGNMIQNPVELATSLKLKSLAYGWKDTLINGDHAVNAKQFEGLKKRIASYPTRQTVYAAASNAAGLDATASAANARKIIASLDRAFKYCNNGNVSAIYCNEAFILGLNRIARLLGGNIPLDKSKNLIDQEITTYRGVPLYDMGLKKDQVTEIITCTEPGGDATANTTSLYFASYSIEQGIYGAQLDAPKVYDPLNGGEMSTAPAKMRRIDWWNGIVGFGGRGLVRVRNIKDPDLWTE